MIRTLSTPAPIRKPATQPSPASGRLATPAAKSTITFSGNEEYSARYLSQEHANQPSVIKSILDQQKGTLFGEYYNPGNIRLIVGWITPKVTNMEVIDMLATALKNATGDINSPLLPHKNSMLHVAVSAGHPAIVKRLLELGARPDLRNTMGETPKDWLGRMSPERTKVDKKAIRQLLDNPPPVQEQEESGWFGNIALPSMSSLYEKSATLASSLISPFSPSNTQTQQPSDESITNEDTASALPATDEPVVAEPKTRDMGVQVEDEEKKSLLSEKNRLHHHGQKLQTKLDRSEQALTSHKRDLQQQKEQNQRLQRDLSGANQGASKIQKKLDTHTRTLEKLNTDLNTERQGRASDRQQAETRLQSLKQELTQELDTLQSENGKLSKALEASQKANQELKQNLDDTQRLYEAQKPAQEKLKSQLKATESRLQKQIGSLKEKLSLADQGISQLEETAAQAQRDLTAEQKKHQSTLHRLTEQSTALKQEQKAHQQTREALQELQQASEQERQSHAQALSGQRDQVEQEIQAHQKTQAAFAQLQQRFDQEQLAHRQVLRELGIQHGSQVGTLHEQIRQFQDTNLELRQKLNAVLKEKIDLQYANKELEKEKSQRALLEILRQPPKTAEQSTQTEPNEDESANMAALAGPIEDHPDYQRLSKQNSVLGDVLETLWYRLYGKKDGEQGLLNLEDPDILQEREALLNRITDAEAPDGGLAQQSQTVYASPLKRTQSTSDLDKYDVFNFDNEEAEKEQPVLRRVQSFSHFG